MVPFAGRTDLAWPFIAEWHLHLILQQQEFPFDLNKEATAEKANDFETENIWNDF